MLYPSHRTTFADATTDLDIERPLRCSRQTTTIAGYNQVQGTPLPADYRIRVYQLLER
jgi:hypothetical protein